MLSLSDDFDDFGDAKLMMGVLGRGKPSDSIS
jgi:hypothetical protein